MHLPNLLLKRLLRFFGLGIGTTLLILGSNLNPIPSNAQLIPLDRNPSTPISKSTRPSIDLLVQQGKTYYHKGQLNQAVTIWLQASDAFATQGDRLHQAMTLSYLAEAYGQLGISDKANNAITRSLELLKQPDRGTKGDRLNILAEAYTIYGKLQLDRGQASEAFTSWQEAEKTFQKAGNSVGTIRSKINQSQALVSLGLYKQANNLLGSLYEKLYEKKPPKETLQLAILLNYGETLRLVGQLSADELPKSQPSGKQLPNSNSLTILQEGLKLAQKLNSPADITAAQLSLGNTYRALQHRQKRLQTSPCPDPTALRYYQQARQFYQQAQEQTNSSTSKIQALLNQQSLLFDNESNNDSLPPAVIAEIQAIASQIESQLNLLPLNRTTLYARIQLAYNLLKVKNNVQASQLLETSVKQAESLGDDLAKSYALGYLGQTYEQKVQGGNVQELTNKALTLTNQALGLAEMLNVPEIGYRWFWQMGRLYRPNNPERAIQSYWSAYQMLKTLRQDIPADNPDLQFSFQHRSIDPVYRELVDLLLQQSQTVENEPLLDNKNKNNPKVKKSEDPHNYPLSTARQVMQDLQSAQLANFLQEPCAPNDVEEIDKRVDGDNKNNNNPEKAKKANVTNSFTAALYTILLPSRIEVIAKFPGQPLFHYSSSISELDVKNTIAQFQLDLQEPYTFDNVKQEGQKIYQWLITKPIEEKLEQAHIKTIVFDLDGLFRNIPMAALHDGKGYLIEKYAVAVTLNLEIKDPKPIKKDRLNVLAASLTKPPSKFRKNFGELPFVKKEVASIIKSTQGNSRVTPLQDESFTRKLFNKKFGDFSFQIVHLATHGQFSSKPEETFILTASSPFDEGKVKLNDFDEMFRTRVLNRADTIELLILSACETAAGDDRATLGMAGVAIKAGASSAIASLWSLDDESTQKLMEKLYKTIIQSNTSRAEALRQAQLALLQEKDGLYTHPLYWAPFLLIGNWL